MPFSNAWESQYSKGRHLSVYPWSDLVSLVMRYAHQKNFSQRPRVLELGCGVGANIPLFIDKGFDYYTVEGSQAATDYVSQKFGDKITIICHDFTENIPFDGDFFDLIVDRGSTTHNCSNDIKRVISEVRRCLKNDCLFIASDWFSTDNYAFNEGDKMEPHTRHNYKNGFLAGCGVVHFFDENELKELFSTWVFLYLVKKIYQSFNVKSESLMIKNNLTEARWDLVVKNKT